MVQIEPSIVSLLPLASHFATSPAIRFIAAETVQDKAARDGRNGGSTSPPVDDAVPRRFLLSRWAKHSQHPVSPGRKTGPIHCVMPIVLASIQGVFRFQRFAIDGPQVTV